MKWECTRAFLGGRGRGEGGGGRGGLSRVLHARTPLSFLLFYCTLVLSILTPLECEAVKTTALFLFSWRALSAEYAQVTG